MQVTAETIDDVTFAVIHVDEIDATNSEDLRREVAPLLAKHKKLVLDLNRIRFIDSRGCGTILAFLKEAGANGSTLCLCQVTKPVMTTFSLIRLHKICKVFDTREAALAELNA